MTTHLRERRDRAGLTQVELARRSGISVRSIGNIERCGVQFIRYSTMRRLLLGLGLTWQDREDVFPRGQG